MFAFVWIAIIEASVGSLAMLAIVGSIVAFAAIGKGEVKRFETSASAQEVINSVVTILWTNKRWTVVVAGQSKASFAYHRPPSKLIAFVLLLMFIAPGIVYLVLAESGNRSRFPRARSAPQARWFKQPQTVGVARAPAGTWKTRLALSPRMN